MTRDLVPPVGFEPTILGLRGRSFNQLSYRGINNSAPTRIRTET